MNAKLFPNVNIRSSTLGGVILIAALSRLAPHPPNFTPIGAIALFGGAHFARTRIAFGVPLAAMLLSDVALGLFWYGLDGLLGSMPFIYGSFALIVGLGRWVRGHRSPRAISAAALTGSILFFVIADFGVWLHGGLYPMTWEGLMACYTAAIPYYRNMLLGDLFYTAVLFGGFALAQRRVAALREGPPPHALSKTVA